MLIGDKFTYPNRYTVLVHDVPFVAAVAWLEAVCPTVTIWGYTPAEMAENGEWMNKVGVVIAGDDSAYEHHYMGLYNYDGRIQLLQLPDDFEVSL